MALPSRQLVDAFYTRCHDNRIICTKEWGESFFNEGALRLFLPPLPLFLSELFYLGGQSLFPLSLRHVEEMGCGMSSPFPAYSNAMRLK
ncbi:hypothetical protein CEXT_158471 [Caerostris extrusa]|uniref:Uncharacterized protein n=1 Tax=Caerostris extrusa TaxID=172846 RepID=A0AAV4WXW2_CAEEX|nr:hypothetical protein CEXT_158471 [Caerostris extrusa]